MITKKHIITSGVVVTLLMAALSAAYVYAEDQAQVSTNVGVATPTLATRPQPMVLEVGAGGRALIRGTISAVGSSSVTIKSWGGDWMVNFTTSTQLLPTSDLTQFKVGDFVGAQGTVSQTALWTIDASLIRDWTTRKEIQVMEKTNKQEIKDIRKTQTPKNWEGKASNINASANSLTLTVDGITYTVNIVTGAKVVNQKYLTASFADIKEGDTVRVWGPSIDTTITASLVRDVSIMPK